jgi:hypothetical protein
MYSLESAICSSVAAGWLLFPLPNGLVWFAMWPLSISRVLGDTWKSRRTPPIFFDSLPLSDTLNAGYGVFQTLVFGERSYS